MVSNESDRIPPLTVFRLYQLKKGSHSLDPTYNNVNASIITQLAMNLSVIVACVPFSRPIMKDVKSGILGGFRINSTAHGSPDSSTARILKAMPQTRGRPGDGFLLTPESNSTKPFITSGRNPAETLTSRCSSLGSNRMVIKQTMGFAVHSEQVRSSLNSVS